MLSSIVQLADINDFINPNQNCVKPLLSTSSSSNTPAKINLIDCLACNGCITSAETILIQEHSLSKHNAIKHSSNKLSIAIISPQSIESICYKFKLTRELCLTTIDHILQCDMYFNIEEITPYMLDLIYNEFINRTKSVICSGCPGWVCYAEKKVGPKAFDYMSKLKSSQEIMSIIIRKIILSTCSSFITNNDVLYICTLMPCFDKKIESVRNSNEINCVLSTIELETAIRESLSLISQHQSIQNKKCYCYYTCNDLVDLIKTFHSKYESALLTFECFMQFVRDGGVKGSKCVNDFSFYENDSSGGYAEYILYRIINDNKGCLVERKKGRNVDIKEIIVYDCEGNKLCSLCIAYGFRNVQNIVRNLKQNKIFYDYIELMACPGGCYNGGGQLRSENNKPRELLLFLESKSLPYIQKQNHISYNTTIKQLLQNNNINISYIELTQQFHAIEYSISDLKW